MRKKIIYTTLIILATTCLVFFAITAKFSAELKEMYHNRESVIISDRNAEIISIEPNEAGYYADYVSEFPDELEELLLKQEDQYFYYHPGINLFSTIRAGYRYITGQHNLASSTITQQISKILLETETKRNLYNKLKESWYAISLELHSSKDEIINMYLNSVYLGNQIQGVELASHLYFDKVSHELETSETLQIIASISSPSENHPFTKENLEKTQELIDKFELDVELDTKINPAEVSSKEEKFQNHLHNPTSFELSSLDIECNQDCQLTFDKELNDKIREILEINLLKLAKKNVSNGAIVVLKLPENELLAMVGSPDPGSQLAGKQINMAIKARPIGSTVKPFIYLKGFEKGLRPYTTVEDKEYKYIIGTGYPFYPKNYDYEYRGEVSLHYALSNSLNVPTVKVLEYVGLEDFYDFLLTDLEFEPVQPLENYQLGIALGGLEMDLLNLAYYFSIFPKEGSLTALNVYESGQNFDLTTHTNFLQDKQIASKEYIQLINKILSDRQTGVEQFGLKSNLNLSQTNVAVKTGTSREYHDSWTIGYTPDFLVGVWLGNGEDTAMDHVSGESGAGKIWNEVMNLLINSDYNKATPFNFDLVEEFKQTNSIEYGLADDDYESMKQKMSSNSLISYPHDGDILLLGEDMRILLKAREEVKWYINNELLEEGPKTIFAPSTAGNYQIRAEASGQTETISIEVVEE
ncbi:MAG: transglycosylase domain-containing protein [Candidatus Gracilibacteria bacterium]|nr:transglycosylase domain-containing protein [Candidatus Gracilibacteria bacterium]